jgi:hypothetical protein
MAPAARPRVVHEVASPPAICAAACRRRPRRPADESPPALPVRSSFSSGMP